jgi:hypothetical protein
MFSCEKQGMRQLVLASSSVAYLLHQSLCQLHCLQNGHVHRSRKKSDLFISCHSAWWAARARNGWETICTHRLLIIQLGFCPSILVEYPRGQISARLSVIICADCDIATELEGWSGTSSSQKHYKVLIILCHRLFYLLTFGRTSNAVSTSKYNNPCFTSNKLQW